MCVELTFIGSNSGCHKPKHNLKVNYRSRLICCKSVLEWGRICVNLKEHCPTWNFFTLTCNKSVFSGELWLRSSKSLPRQGIIQEEWENEELQTWKWGKGIYWGSVHAVTESISWFWVKCSCAESIVLNLKHQIFFLRHLEFLLIYSSSRLLLMLVESDFCINLPDI